MSTLNVSSEIVTPDSLHASSSSPRVLTLRSASTLDALLDTGDAIRMAQPWDTNDVGYICSGLVQATLPYKEPKGNPPAWGRTNGRVSLVIQPGYFITHEKVVQRGRTITVQTPKSLGYPFGTVPRLLLPWMGREVKRVKSREISLGNSLVEFMNGLGMTAATGGKKGSITRLRDQVRRLFSSKIAILDNPGPPGTPVDWQSDGFNLADKSQFWWDTEEALRGQSGLYDSRIYLSERFYEELASHPVPVDLRALRALSRNPAALDLYTYLTWRMFSLTRDTEVPWEVLRMQFGTETADLSKFRQLMRENLKKVLLVYPDARVLMDSRHGMILRPSPTSVRKLLRASEV
jgi:hypothetical protein